jgi:proteasome accessory factor B
MTSQRGDVAISKTQRWLDLIAFLVRHRFPVDVEAVWEGVPAYRERVRAAEAKDETGRATALATLRRMFERDKDELRAAGIPIETVEYTIEHGAEVAHGYRLAARDFYLPYLRLTAKGAGGREVGTTGGMGGSRPLELSPEDAQLALDALRRVRDLPDSPFAKEARYALNKLTFDLDPTVLAEPPVVFAPRAVLASPPAAAPPSSEDLQIRADPHGAPGVRDTLRALSDAIRDRRRVAFRYHGIHRGEPTDRDVAPYGMLFQHGQWYLIGADASRDDSTRVFRLGRMEAPEAGKAGSYEIAADFDVADHARRRPWELGDDEPLDADVRFEFPLALWAERNGYGERVREGGGGAVVRRFAVRQTDSFLRWLQGFAGDAIVEAPRELRAAQVELARSTMAAHGAGDGPGAGDRAADGEAHGA